MSDRELNIVCLCVFYDISDPIKAVPLQYAFLLNHGKLISSIIAFARHCWPLGLFISIPVKEMKGLHTLNSTSEYTLCYLTSTQNKWSLEIQNWLGLMCTPPRFIPGPFPYEYSTNLKVYTFFWSWVYMSHVMLKCTHSKQSWSKWVKRLVATGHRASVRYIGHNSSSDYFHKLSLLVSWPTSFQHFMHFSTTWLTWTTTECIKLSLSLGLGSTSVTI